jgi:catechol 2,3-dioxygenase-like lactoylglutathione lyase family enzyme
MDEQPVFDQVNLIVNDMDASVAFYRHLGVAIPDSNDPLNAHHRSAEMPGEVHFDLDSAKFARQWDTGWTGGEGGAVFGFRVSSRQAVDDTYAKLIEAGYQGEQPPYDAFFGARYAVVRDPDRHAVGIMSPRDADQQQPAPRLDDRE